MKFTEKLKARLYASVVIAILGVLLIGVGLFRRTDMASSFGLMFLVIGIARIVQYIKITKNEETLHKREVAETDERNVMLWTKARSLTFSIYILLAAIASVILYMLEMDIIAKTLSYSLFSFILIYWICYFVISRKY
ncbi:MAG: hypothetical protein ACI4QW_03285 [Clostridia bacterium]